MGLRRDAITLLAVGSLLVYAGRWPWVVPRLVASGTVVAAPAQGGEPSAETGRVDLTITGEGGDIRVELVGQVASLVGFQGPPSTEEERAALRITRENLKTGDALVRFSTRARCRLESAAVDIGGTAGGAKPPATGAPLARYRFACEAPERLDSAALGLFAAFPVLQRAFVHYAVDGIRGDAELSRARPVASFVPLY